MLVLVLREESKDVHVQSEGSLAGDRTYLGGWRRSAELAIAHVLACYTPLVREISSFWADVRLISDLPGRRLQIVCLQAIGRSR